MPIGLIHRTETFGCQFFFGMLLCDFSLHPPVQAFVASKSWLRRLLSVSLMVFGLFMASFPSHNPEWCGWSRFLLSLEWWIFPAGTALPKRFSAVGVDMFILGVFLSPTARGLLERDFILWLGRNSFAVYLTHGTLLRTVLVWMFYGISGQPFVENKNEEGELVGPWLPRCGRTMMSISIVVWLVIVYTAAHLWTTHVDALCARITQRLEKWSFEEENEKMNVRLPK